MVDNTGRDNGDATSVGEAAAAAAVVCCQSSILLVTVRHQRRT